MRDILIRADGLNAGRSPQPASPAWILVRDGAIAYSGPVRPEGVGPDALTLEGGFLMKPLADAHVHLFLCGAFDPAERVKTASLDRDDALERILNLLEGYRTLGIAAVRDGGDPLGLALLAARIANERPQKYARVAASGEPIFRSGRYGGFLGRGVGTLDEAYELMEENLAAGANQVKILSTGLNSLEVAGEVGPVQFDEREMKALTIHARFLGLPTMVHANGPSLNMIKAAPSSLEHAFWLAEGDFKALKESGATWTPTLGAWGELARNPYLGLAQLKVVDVTDRRHRREVGAGSALGIPIASGSDAGTPGVTHGAGLHGEMIRLGEAGLTAGAVIASSTTHAMALCGADCGGLEEGRKAGFVWLDADPADDLSVLNKPRGVFLGGELTLNQPKMSV